MKVICKNYKVTAPAEHTFYTGEQNTVSTRVTLTLILKESSLTVEEINETENLKELKTVINDLLKEEGKKERVKSYKDITIEEITVDVCD